MEERQKNASFNPCASRWIQNTAIYVRSMSVRKSSRRDCFNQRSEKQKSDINPPSPKYLTLSQSHLPLPDTQPHGGIGMAFIMKLTPTSAITGSTDQGCVPPYR